MNALPREAFFPIYLLHDSRRRGGSSLRQSVRRHHIFTDGTKTIHFYHEEHLHSLTTLSLLLGLEKAVFIQDSYKAILTTMKRFS